jgi:histidyl-tRNA synthetase
MRAIQSGKGFVDLFPPQSEIFTSIESQARSVFARYGCKELRTPIVEFTELFVRGIGDETDVVQKEMYTFPDRKGRSMTLRPEATAGVLRACIQHGLLSQEGLAKFFTIGPMFRYERPQKGRQRQFHQVNVEVLGSKSYLADADVLFMLHAFLTEIGLSGLIYELNNLGCAQCRPMFRQALEDYFGRVRQEELCADCRRRIRTNPLRVLDCKAPACREITKDAPSIANYVCNPCQRHFDQVLTLLEASSLQTRFNPFLVRGLDYYQGMTFEVVSLDLGAQASVAGGGRYDGLVRQLGGPDVPGIGFACGTERLAMLASKPMPPSLDAFIATSGDQVLSRAALLARDLRAKGFSLDFFYDSKSMKSQLRAANKQNARACIILEDTGKIFFKNMLTGEQTPCSEDQLVENLRLLRVS